jgi:Flp pilus assembly protein CpaB
MTYRTRNIIMASGLALLAVVFMLLYVSKSRNDSNIGKKLISVFVAGHDIQQGTPGSSLNGNALVKKSIPKNAEVPGAIVSPQEVRGLVATQETLSGEQVTLRRFGPLGATGPRAQVQKQQRVVQLAGDADQVLDGTLQAGDRVDVVGSWNVPEGCSSCHRVHTIVTSALVLATSADLPSGNTTSTTKSVQLRLTGHQAERVLWMEKNGDWWLVLRPVLKPKNTPGVSNAGTIYTTARQGPGR